MKLLLLILPMKLLLLAPLLWQPMRLKPTKPLMMMHWLWMRLHRQTQLELLQMVTLPLLLVQALLLLLTSFLPFPRLSAGGNRGETPVAVLSEQEYFGEGLAEEIINALTRIEGLQVTARTSSFAFNCIAHEKGAGPRHKN